MENRINIIKSISYTRCNEVTRFEYLLSGKAKIETTTWHEIPKGIADPSISIKDEQTTAGKLFTTDINIPLKENIIETGAVILKIDFCESPSILIGSPDLPVQLNSITQAIGKRMEINHKSWHYPIEYTL